MRIIIEPSDQNIDPDDFLSTVSTLIALTELTIIGSCSVTLDDLAVVETTFEITKIAEMGGPFFTVWKREGETLSSDHRWNSEALAESAMALYEFNPAFHGSDAYAVVNEYKDAFGSYPDGLVAAPDKKV